jgi:hypothetical protein
MVIFCSRCSRSMISNICSTSSGDRPIEGSSNSITRGCAITARPMASICCSPPDSSGGHLVLALASGAGSML